MPLSDTLSTIPDQLLEAIEMTQQLVLTNVSATAATAKALGRNVPDLPFADRLPDPVRLTGNAFDFATKLMASQKDFSLKLLEALTPVEPVRSSGSRPAASKPAAK